MSHKLKISYIFVVLLILLAVWVLYSINQPPMWKGSTQDGQWRADYNREANAPKGDWIGKLAWKGQNEVQLVGAELTKNGELVHTLENRNVSLTMEDHSVTYYHTWEPISNSKKDHLQLTIFWEDENGKHEDHIVMTPKNRYFVIPSFLQ
ncbi:hypothetical protein [Caldalkalibacillus mannanilyticus]|uniref:hypothetical protein n=1 Tax=Caldalkalibacillus mannanilyticus TaxID=1418 RepID=UPI00046807A6|nr:hypothetical protein [Caldalkalibacillus mannanilyticus]